MNTPAIKGEQKLILEKASFSFAFRIEESENGSVSYNYEFRTEEGDIIEVTLTACNPNTPNDLIMEVQGASSEVEEKFMASHEMPFALYKISRHLMSSINVIIPQFQFSMQVNPLEWKMAEEKSCMYLKDVLISLGFTLDTYDLTEAQITEAVRLADSMLEGNIDKATALVRVKYYNIKLAQALLSYSQKPTDR